MDEYKHADYDTVGDVLSNGDKKQGKKFAHISTLTILILGCYSSAREIHESNDPFFTPELLRDESYMKSNRTKKHEAKQNQCHIENYLKSLSLFHAIFRFINNFNIPSM